VLCCGAASPRHVGERGGARTFLLSAPQDGIAQFLRDADERYGSAAAYLDRAGLDPAPARELKRRLAVGSA
jgi:hypothetical protein